MFSKPGSTSCPSHKAGGNDLKRRSGFSLVELMVVMVIIGLLAGVVTLTVQSRLVTSRQNIAKLELSRLSEAINSFYVQYNRYPTTQEGLQILIQPSEKFTEGVIVKLNKDPWGNDYDYISPARNAPFEIITYGADKREGGSGADTDISTLDLGDDR